MTKSEVKLLIEFRNQLSKSFKNVFADASKSRAILSLLEANFAAFILSKFKDKSASIEKEVTENDK